MDKNIYATLNGSVKITKCDDIIVDFVEANLSLSTDYRLGSSPGPKRVRK